MKCPFCDGTGKHYWGLWILDWLIGLVGLSFAIWFPFDWYERFPGDGFPWRGVFGGLLVVCPSALAFIGGVRHGHGKSLT